MLELLKSIDAFAWGPPLLILLVGTGIYLTMRLGLLQVLRLPKAFQLIFIRIRDMVMYPVCSSVYSLGINCWNRKYHRSCDGYQGWWTRALFWMWMAAFFGMATKYAEGLLAIKYRTKDDHGAVAEVPCTISF